MNDYDCIKGKKICRVLTHSELFTTKANSTNRLVRIDAPLYLLLEDETILRLFGEMLSVVQNYQTQEVRALFEKQGTLNDAEQALQCLCGRTILDAYAVLEDFCEENTGKPRNVIALHLTLDGGLQLETYTAFDEFSDIEFYF